MTNRDVTRTIKEVGNPNRFAVKINSNDIFLTLLNAHLFVKPNQLEKFYEAFGQIVLNGKREGEKRFANLGGTESLDVCIEAMTVVETMYYIKEWFDMTYFNKQTLKMNMNAPYDQDVPLARLHELDDSIHYMLEHDVIITIG